MTSKPLFPLIPDRVSREIDLWLSEQLVVTRVAIAVGLIAITGIVGLLIVSFIISPILDNQLGPLFFSISILVGIAIYLLPTIIAFRRHHRQRKAIAVLNVFVGWTFLGWVGALVWSFTADTEYEANAERD